MADDSLSDDEIRALADLDEQLRSGRPPEDTSLAGQDVLLRLERHFPRTGFPDTTPSGAPCIGPYEIAREIGRGGFGVVFLARERDSGQTVALKVPRPELFLSEEVRRRFLVEASAIATLTHVNIIRVHDVGYAGPICYIASAYCEGVSLAEALAQRTQPFTPRAAAAIIQQLAGAVHYVHQSGLLHRDLKPSNVLLWPDEQAELGFVPKLTDFGLAKFVEQSLEDTRSSVLLGTPLYMAPEQAECRHEEVGPWTDVYALGAMLYELLAGEPPFAGQGLLVVLNRVRHEAPRPPSSLSAEIPEPLSRVCLKCLEKEPRDRYASAGELCEDLQRFLDGRPVVARAPSLWRQCQKFVRQPERMRDAGVWTMLLNAGLIVWMWGMMLAVTTHPAWLEQLKVAMIVQTLVASVALHLPQVFIGWYTLHRRRWSLLAGLGFGTLQLVMAVVPLFGGPGPFSRMYPNDLALANVFWFLAILFSVQVALYLMALIAQRRTRE